LIFSLLICLLRYHVLTSFEILTYKYESLFLEQEH